MPASRQYMSRGSGYEASRGCGMDSSAMKRSLGYLLSSRSSSSAPAGEFQGITRSPFTM